MVYITFTQTYDNPADKMVLTPHLPFTTSNFAN